MLIGLDTRTGASSCSNEFLLTRAPKCPALTYYSEHMFPGVEAELLQVVCELAGPGHTSNLWDKV